MKVYLILIISVIFLTSCERLEDSFILNGQMVVNNERIILSRGSIQFSNVSKLQSDGSKQYQYSYYRLNISPSSDNRNNPTIKFTAYDRSNSQKTTFFTEDIEISLTKPTPGRNPGFLIYEEVIEAELKINKISRRNVVEGIFSAKVKSSESDTLTIKNGSFTSRLEVFETTGF